MSGSIKDSGDAKVKRLVAHYLQGAAVTVGIHEIEGAAKKMEARAEGRGKKKMAAVFSGETLAEVATKHELGIGVPQRSFIGAWVDENEGKLYDRLKAVADRAARRQQPMAQAIMRYGHWAAGQVKRRIIAGIAPELSERRKREKAILSGGKAKDTPLIFTAQLLSSIRAEQEKV